MAFRYPSIVILLGTTDSRGVWQFLFASPDFVGIPFIAKVGRSLGNQILEAVESAVKAKLGAEKLNIIAPIEPPLTWADGQAKSLLLLCSIQRESPMQGEWLTMPDILRRIPKGRNRLIFMKVIQRLSNDPDSGVEAVELTEELIQSLEI